MSTRTIDSSGKDELQTYGVRGENEVLSRLKRDMEERQCRVNGHTGHVERVYQRRGMAKGVWGCKVILDSGRVVYSDINDVAVF